MKVIVENIIIVLTVMAINCSCCKEKARNEEIEMIFVAPLNITPIRDTFQVGDTMTFEMNTPDSLFDLTTNKRYKLVNFDFKSFINLSKLVDDNKTFFDQPGAISKFDYLNEVGSFTNFSSYTANADFLYSQSMYKIQIKIVCKESGTFALVVFSEYPRTPEVIDQINLGTTNSGGKKLALLKQVLYPINNGQVNYQILKDNIWTDEERFGQVPANEKELFFAFVVK